jgi:hypothetical protein
LLADGVRLCEGTVLLHVKLAPELGGFCGGKLRFILDQLRFRLR